MMLAKRNHIVQWLTVGHFLNDFFASGSLAIIIAAQTNRLDLSGADIGLAGALFQGVSVFQPGIGWLADRLERPYLLLLGAMVTALGTLSISLADTIPVIWAGAVVGGLGSAAFHPIALAGTRAFAPMATRGRSIALFMLGGNGAFALSPLVFGYVIDHYGLGSYAPFVMMNVLFVPVMVRQLGPHIRGRLDTAKPDTSNGEAAYIVVRYMMGAYLVVVFLRSVLNQVLSLYLPLYYTQQDRSLEFAGMATFVLLVFKAFGAYIGAALSDFFPRRLILLVSLIASTPLLFVLLEAHSVALIFVSSALLGLMVNASWPIFLMIGQEIMPGGAVGASGFTFGWGFASGSLGVLLVGLLVDVIGLGNALLMIAATPLLALGLIFLLPDAKNDVREYTHDIKSS
ncbi:MAG: MFS transporter [Chloroflexi bacterium]|nr:MFS transporter [Chloroflexota bacterium]